MRPGRLETLAAKTMLFVAALALAQIAPAGPSAAEEGRVTGTVTGTVTHADHVELPPGAVLKVTLEDVSVADAPSVVVATDTRTNLGAPPYRFSLGFDPASIDRRHTYSVRARVSLGDRLLMTTDTHAAVITRDAPTRVEVILRPVSTRRGRTGRVHTAPGLTLPATFTGTTPLASGPGLAWHLDLWPDQVYHLRQTHGAGDPSYDLGRWHADPARDAIVLRGGRAAPVFLEVLRSGDLRLMDHDGTPIENDGSHDLDAGPLQPAQDTQFLTGMFRSMADATTFTECLTGRSYPVATDGAYVEAERAYARLEGHEPGAPVLAALQGRLAMRPAMDGPGPAHLEIVSFSRFEPEWTCATTGGYAGPRSAAELTNTYWKILEIAGQRATPVADRREPHLILRTGDKATFDATVGCNRIRGDYATEGDGLSFGTAAMTRMACPPPLDALEAALAQTLPRVARWKIAGTRLDLFDDSGQTLLRAQAVYFH